MTTAIAALPKTVKAEETRRRIFAAARELFQERGYTATTMRLIAEEAGVAVGSAYYYFQSKESLVLAFYEEVQDELWRRTRGLITLGMPLRESLTLILEAHLKLLEPNRGFLEAVIRAAVSPRHPLSPFSRDAMATRLRAISLLKEAVAAAEDRVHPLLSPALPRGLWLYQMWVILFWLGDSSSGYRRTKRLVAASASALDLLVQGLSWPGMGRLRKAVATLAAAS